MNTAHQEVLLRTNMGKEQVKRNETGGTKNLPFSVWGRGRGSFEEIGYGENELVGGYWPRSKFLL